MKKLNWSGKSIYRKIIIIISAIQVLAFFLIPYAYLHSTLGELNSMARSFGLDSGMPNRLTGFSTLMMFIGPNGMGLVGEELAGVIFACVLLLLTMIVPLIILLVNLFKKGKAGYLIKIITGPIMLLTYIFVSAMMAGMGEDGYKFSPLGPIICVAEVAMFVLAIIGLVKIKEELEKSGGSISVKQGKHDGTLTGIRGSYAGAAIPLKSGTAVFIGRDPKSCSIVVKGENVSRKHCSVTYDEKNNSYSVTDYSVNGVYDRRGRKLESGRVTIMAPGDEIHIGATDEIFRLG